jgi:hypothetical protein
MDAALVSRDFSDLGKCKEAYDQVAALIPG